MARLPALIRPMLARRGEPFDDDEHLFEVKWDGIRAMAYVEEGSYRLVSRRGREITDPFPELGFLADLPAGTLLDGELIVIQDGRPQLSLVQGRHGLRSVRKIRARARSTPSTYVVFDQLYEKFRSLLCQPLSFRRRVLRAGVTGLEPERLVFSEGVVGSGRAFYREVIGRRLEGVMAKRLSSLYRPGQRSDAWLKIKPHHAQGPRPV